MVAWQEKYRKFVRIWSRTTVIFAFHTFYTMKKLLAIALASALSLSAACMLRAQTSDGVDRNLFNHLSIGPSLFDPCGFELAMPAGNKFALRAGVTFFPGVSFEMGSISIPINGSDFNTPVTGSVRALNGHFFGDFYPTGNNKGFHFTAGVFYGRGKVFELGHTNTLPVADDEFVKFNDGNVYPINGHISPYIKTNKVRPYLGLGFGSPFGHRVNVTFDMGVQYIGGLNLYVAGRDKFDDPTDVHVTAEEFLGLDPDDDEAKIFSAVEKVPVTPFMKLSIMVKLF